MCGTERVCVCVPLTNKAGVILREVMYIIYDPYWILWQARCGWCGVIRVAGTVTGVAAITLRVRFRPFLSVTII